MTSSVSTCSKGILLVLRVKPGSRRVNVNFFGTAEPIEVSLTVPAKDNRANRQLMEVLSKMLGVRKSSVLIVSGTHSRIKTVLITDLKEAQMLNLITHASSHSFSATQRPSRTSPLTQP